MERQKYPTPRAMAARTGTSLRYEMACGNRSGLAAWTGSWIHSVAGSDFQRGTWVRAVQVKLQREALGALAALPSTMSHRRFPRHTWALAEALRAHADANARR